LRAPCEASTPERKAAVDAARAKLVNISSLLKLPDAAGCRQTGGEIDVPSSKVHTTVQVGLKLILFP